MIKLVEVSITIFIWQSGLGNVLYCPNLDDKTEICKDIDSKSH